MITINQQWLWDPDDMENTPSALSRIPKAVECQLRLEGITLIKKIGHALNLHTNPTLATASVFFHRFYMVHSFEDHPSPIPALACLFLAGKVEETPKKGRDVAIKAIETYPDKYECFPAAVMDSLIDMENILLQTLRFELHVEHPYKFLIDYAKQFTSLDKKLAKKIVGDAWTFTNDSLGTELCLLWEPEVLAIAMLYMAFKMGGVKLEAQEEENREPIDGLALRVGTDSAWWDNYVSNLTTEMIEEICHKVLDSFQASGHVFSLGE